MTASVQDFQAKEAAVAFHTMTTDDHGIVLSEREWAGLDEAAKEGFTTHDQRDMQRMGKKQEFRVCNKAAPSSHCR